MFPLSLCTVPDSQDVWLARVFFLSLLVEQLAMPLSSLLPPLGRLQSLPNP